MLTQPTSPRRAYRIATLGLALILLAAGLTAPAAAAPPGPAAADDTITWDPNPQIITNALDRANFPRVTIDSNNKTHIVYITRINATQWEIRYINNVGGTFNSPGQLIETMDGNPSVPSAIIIAGPNNVL